MYQLARSSFHAVAVSVNLVFQSVESQTAINLNELYLSFNINWGIKNIHLRMAGYFLNSASNEILL